MLALARNSFLLRRLSIQPGTLPAGTCSWPSCDNGADWNGDWHAICDRFLSSCVSSSVASSFDALLTIPWLGLVVSQSVAFTSEGAARSMVRPRPIARNCSTAPPVRSFRHAKSARRTTACRRGSVFTQNTQNNNRPFDCLRFRNNGNRARQQSMG